MKASIKLFVLTLVLCLSIQPSLKADVVSELDKVLEALKDPEHGYKAAMVKNHKFHVMFYYDLLNADLRGYAQYLSIMANALAEAEFELLELAAKMELEWEKAIRLDEPSEDFPNLIRLAELADKLQVDLERIDRWRSEIVEEQALLQNANMSFCDEDRLFYVTDLFDLSRSHQVRDFGVNDMGSALSNIYANMTGQFQKDYFQGLEDHANYKEPFGISISRTVSEGGESYANFENQYASEGEQARSTVALVLATSGHTVGKQLVAGTMGKMATSAMAQSAAASVVGSVLTAVGVAYLAYQVFDFVKGRLDAMKKEDKILNRVRDIINFLNEPIVSSKESYKNVVAYCAEGSRKTIQESVTAITTTLEETAQKDKELGKENRKRFNDWSEGLWADVILLMADQDPADQDNLRDFVRASLVSEQQEAGYQTQFTIEARKRLMDLEGAQASNLNEFESAQLGAEKALLATQIEVQSDDIGMRDDNNARILNLIRERVE